MKSKRRKYKRRTRRRRGSALIKKYGRKRGKVIPIYGHKIPQRIGRHRFYILWKTTKKNLPGKTYHGRFYSTRKKAQRRTRQRRHRRTRRRQRGGFFGKMIKKGLTGVQSKVKSRMGGLKGKMGALKGKMGKMGGLAKKAIGMFGSILGSGSAGGEDGGEGGEGGGGGEDDVEIIPCDVNERPDYPGGPDGCGKNLSPKPTHKQLSDGYVAEDQIYQLDDF